MLTVMDDYRESTINWEEVLLYLIQGVLSRTPHFVVGYGAFVFWNTLAKVWPSSTQQCYCVHKTANVLEKLPKAMNYFTE